MKPAAQKIYLKNLAKSILKNRFIPNKYSSIAIS